jgi:hypothetical protein
VFSCVLLCNQYHNVAILFVNQQTVTKTTPILTPHTKAKSQIIFTNVSSSQHCTEQMSRSKIVKEAGVKPTDFENTVAKVRFMLFEDRIVRENFARDVYICAEIFTPFFLLAQKNGGAFLRGVKMGL